jgi:hypothetical protein
MLCETFYYRKKRESFWGESLAVPSSSERRISEIGIEGPAADARMTGAVPIPSGTSVEPTPASLAGSVFSFPESSFPFRREDAVSSDPMASMVKSGRNLLQPCVAVAQDPTGYCSKYELYLYFMHFLIAHLLTRDPFSLDYSTLMTNY